MAPGMYNEDSLVEQPAIQLFAELGWETLSASDEVLGNASPSDETTSSLSDLKSHPLTQ